MVAQAFQPVGTPGLLPQNNFSTPARDQPHPRPSLQSQNSKILLRAMEIIVQSKPRKKKGFLARLLSATPEQARDTGMALALLVLIIIFLWGFHRLVGLAMILLIITMVWPRAFQPLAGLWFGLSHVIGTVMSHVILTVLFFVLVTPIGLIRRLLGADSLQLKKWKRDEDSVFAVRADLIQKKDLQAPY